MDIIAFNEASTANGRIENFIENPDSTSGVLTVPKTIAAGETITIPTGRVAILPDLQVDGDLVINGDLFIPTGSMTSQVVQKVISTDNAVVRFDGATGQVQNSGVTIDDNSNISINTTYNSQKLSLKGDIGLVRDTSFHGEEIGATIKVTSSAVWYSDGSDLVFSTMAGDNVEGGTVAERMRIDSAGNIGFSVTPSAWITTAENRHTLQIKNGAISATPTTIEINNNYYRDSSYVNRYLSNGYASFYGQGSDGGHRWHTAPSGVAGNAIAWTNAMTLGANGNLLVGTTTDNGVDKLQVNGGISKKIENSNGVEFKLGNAIWSISIPQGTVQTANQIFSTMSIPVNTGGMYILYAMVNNTSVSSSKIYHFHSAYDGGSSASALTLISQGGYSSNSYYGNCKLTLTTTATSTTLNFVAEANITSQTTIAYHLVKIGI